MLQGTCFVALSYGKLNEHGLRLRNVYMHKSYYKTLSSLRLAVYIVWCCLQDQNGKKLLVSK
jgi:hypothetical protein